MATKNWKLDASTGNADLDKMIQLVSNPENGFEMDKNWANRKLNLKGVGFRATDFNHKVAGKLAIVIPVDAGVTPKIYSKFPEESKGGFFNIDSPRAQGLLKVFSDEVAAAAAEFNETCDEPIAEVAPCEYEAVPAEVVVVDGQPEIVPVEEEVAA